MGGSDDDRARSDLANDATVSAAGVSRVASGESVVGDVSLARGTQVGEYVIEEVLGQGGFGTVYLANQPVIGKRVAIKVLSRKYSADTEMVSRFASEARAVNQIKHRNIIDIFSFGQLADGRQYYVMEHLEGEPLDAYLAAEGALTLAQALPILRAIARALDAAHAKGVAHRDLKPENVFLARDDEGAMFPKLLDFGIAKLTNSEEALAHRTSTGVPIGTPYYMSPEQCRGQNVDHRTDIYSFGVLSYRLLTGKYPFEGGMVDILHHQMYDEPAAPSSHVPALGTTVDVAIAWMMRKDPEQRPKTVIAAVVALQDDKTPTPLMTPSTIKQIERQTPPRKRTWIAAAIGAAVAIGAVVAVIALRGDDRKITPTDSVKVHELDVKMAVPLDAAAVAVDAAVASEGSASRGSAAPSIPKLVTLKITGAPPGTEVRRAGLLLGPAPGELQTDGGSAKVQLLFTATGYKSETRWVVPDQDLTIDIKLVQIRRATSVNPNEDPNAIIDLDHSKFQGGRK